MLTYEHGGDIYRNKNVRIDLSKSLNPLGMPENVKSALLANIGTFANYPDALCESLRLKIAERERVSADNIVCGNGANELIYAICRAVQPQTGKTLKPTFSEYEKALAVVGAAMTDDRADLMFVCTPNNPTGKLTPLERLSALAAQCKFLVIDECFIDFTVGESFVRHLPDFPNVIVLKAFTKIYAMAGLRLGYAISTNSELLSAMQAQLPCWNVSVPAQVAGIAALDNADWRERTVEYVAREREFLIAVMERKLRVFDSDANFIFFETDKPIYELMLSYGILIRRWDAAHYRVAVSTRENNREFAARLNEL